MKNPPEDMAPSKNVNTPARHQLNAVKYNAVRDASCAL
jgi:hypothetical protein